MSKVVKNIFKIIIVLLISGFTLNLIRGVYVALLIFGIMPVGFGSPSPAGAISKFPDPPNLIYIPTQIGWGIMICLFILLFVLYLRLFNKYFK